MANIESDHGPPGDSSARGLPPGLLSARQKRRHDRSRYPWRQKRRKRKLIQITVTSSVALLFLVGSLYLLLSLRGRSEGEGAGGVGWLRHVPQPCATCSTAAAA